MTIKKALCMIALCSPVFPALAGNTTPIYSLADVKNALNQGANISVTVDLTKCKPSGTTTGAGTVQGGLKINAYRITPDGALSFSDEHPTVDANGNPIWQFIRYKVSADQTVAFSSYFFSLPSYTPLGPQISYACTVNQGIAFFTEHR